MPREALQKSHIQKTAFYTQTITETDTYHKNFTSKFSVYYSPYGTLLDGRHGNENSYRFGFNGMEKDDEIKNISGSSYTTEFRQYDPRLGRWFSLDPKSNLIPFESPYAFCYNSPCSYTDNGGDLPDPVLTRSSAIHQYLKKYHFAELKAVYDANNMRLSHLYEYAKSYGKKYSSLVIGAFGEAQFYKTMNAERARHKGNINKSIGLFPYGVSTKIDLGRNINGYQIDMVHEITIIVGGTIEGTDYNLKHTDLSGEEQITFIESEFTSNGKHDRDQFNVGYEIKTNNQYSDVKWLFSAFETGVNQIKARVNLNEIDVMVLVFDYDAMQKILNSSEYGDKARQLYQEMLDYRSNDTEVDSDQVLFLRLEKDLYKNAKGMATHIASDIRSNFPTKEKAAAGS